MNMSINKRNKEKQRQARQQEKEARRKQRREDSESRAPVEAGMDPDIAGIIPGPQPIDTGDAS